MTDFIIKLLDFSLLPFREVNNIIIIVPLSAGIVSMLFGIMARLMNGGRIK